MIEFKPRKDLGFDTDDFDGFIVRKDNRSILQLHLYRDFYTLFWLGRSTVPKLWQCLRATARELRTRFDTPLNTGVARYLIDATIRRFPFTIEPRSILDDLETGHDEFISEMQRAISFARYEMHDKIPVILWADFSVGDQTEIGFSAREVVPGAITELIGQTSIAGIDSDELKQINVGLADRIK